MMTVIHKRRLGSGELAVARKVLLSIIVAYTLFGLAGCAGTTLTGSSSSPVTGQPDSVVVSHLNISAGPENITDLWAHRAASGRSYAYLGTFDRPFCAPGITGVHIVDITDARHPQKVGFIPSPAGTRANDVKVESVRTAFFSGDILVHSVEFCANRQTRPPASESAGIVIYDVTDPLNPRATAPAFSLGFEVHNTFIYQQGERAFVLVVQDEGQRDFHIVEITDPSSPRRVSDRGWRDWFDPAVDQLFLGEMPVPFLHDVWAKSFPADAPNPVYAGKTIAYLAYWDAGLVLLDITDPSNPVFLGDSDYTDPDPLSGQPPEGNSHVAVPTADGNFVVMGDEDFSPFRTVFTIDTGEFAGKYPAIEARFGRPVKELERRTMTGPTVFVGLACADSEVPPPPTTPLPPGERYIALIERGTCPFDEKVARVAGAGYGGAIIFNQADAPDRLIQASGDPAKGTIPAVFIRRSTAFAILGISPQAPLTTPLPPPGTVGWKVSLKSIFDGWGYLRVLDVSNPAEIVEVGQYATENAMNESVPAGDRTMHNVIVDGRRAYIAWYADGIRVVDFSDPANPREVGRFVDTDSGSNFWGVYLFQHPDGNTYVLGSDRDTGLWILRFD